MAIQKQIINKSKQAKDLKKKNKLLKQLIKKY